MSTATTTGLSIQPAVNGQPITTSPPTSPVPNVNVNASSGGNPADNNITSPTVAAAAAIASRKMGTDGKDSLTTFINEFTNDASNWSILDANTRDQRIADWRAFRRGFIWRQFWDGLFKNRTFIDHTGTAISQRADGHFAASPEGKGVRGAIAKRHGENKKIARQQQTAVYAENLKVFKEHRPLLEALIDLQGKDVYHEGPVEVKPEPMDPLSSDDLYGRIAHRKLYKRVVNDQDIKHERPHQGYRWGALDVITFPFAGILTYDLRAKQPIAENEQSGRVVLPAAQGTIFSVSSCVSNVRRDAAQSLTEINGLVEENKVHANDRRLRRVLWALSDQIIKCKKFKRPLGVDEKRSGVSTKIIQGTLSVGYPDPTAARTLEPDGCGLYFNVKVVKSGGCMSKAVDELVPHGQIDAKSIMELNKPLWEKKVAEEEARIEAEHNKMRLDLYEKQHTLSYDFMVRVYTQPGHAEFFVPNPQELYALLCDTEKIDAFAGDAKYPARAGADHPLVKYLFPNGPQAPRQELIDVYNRINNNPSVGELYWLKTWVGVIRSMKLREREKRLKERETKRLRERKQEQQERMEQERLEREWHQAMQKWQDNPLPESEKGAKPVRPVRQPTSSLAVAPSANPAIDLFAVEPAIDYSNFQSIAYQPSRLPQLMERLSKLTEILSRPSTSAPAEIFYTKLYQRLRVLEPDNANWADTTATPPQPSPPPPAVVQPVINDGKKKKKAHAHDDRAKATSPTLASPQAASPANGHTEDGDDADGRVPPKKAVVVANGHTHDGDDANSESGDESEAKDTADHKRAAKPAAVVVATSTKKDGKKKAAAADDDAARRERAEQRSCARSMCFSFSSDEKPADTKKAAPVPSATAKDAGAAKTTKKTAGPKATSKAKSKSKAKK